LRDGQEYFDLAPVWDWDLLPGVTFATDAGKAKRQSFVGSVTDGVRCAVAMDFCSGTGDKTLLSGRKFWACDGDVIVCLLSDLSASGANQPVRTALDQCRLRGEVTVCDPSGMQREFAGSETNLSLRWVHHAGFAYAPLNDLKLSIRAGPAIGSWNSINRAFSTNDVTVPVFLAVLEHGSKPSAANGGFVIVSTSVVGVERIFSNPSWHVLRNDSVVQAVEFDDGAIMAAFHKAGELGGGKSRLAVDKPCIVLKRDDRVWICDPNRQ
jgi:chondroitin AC lyase